MNKLIIAALVIFGATLFGFDIAHNVRHWAEENEEAVQAIAHAITAEEIDFYSEEPSGDTGMPADCSMFGDCDDFQIQTAEVCDERC